MFVLVEMVDTVRIPPWSFHRQLNDAIAEELNKKLANKVKMCVYVIIGSCLSFAQPLHLLNLFILSHA